MKKLRVILQYKYLLIALLSIFYSLIFSNREIISKYKINDTSVTGYITNYIIDGNTLSIKINGKEKILAIYYFEKEEQLNEFLNNYKLGDIVTLTGTMNKPSNNRVFNLFNYKKYLKYENISYKFKIDNIKKISNNAKLRYKIKNIVISIIDKNVAKGYLYTFILGNNKYIDSRVMDSYRINGISHLFAVSGMHVTLLSVILLKIFNKFKCKNILVIFFLIFYMFLTDFSPSILRAGIMFILLYINKRLNLKISTVNLMFILLTILIIIDKYIIFKVGFQYSYIISFYLILFNKIIQDGKNKISKLFRVSFIAFLSSIPITINNFFNINILSIILNIFFVPIISSVIFPLSLLSLLLSFIGPLLRVLINIFEYLSLFASKINILVFTMKKMSILIIIIYYIIISFVLYKIQSKKYKFILILLMVLVLHNNINSFDNKKEITFIDVGQGDSALIKMPYNKSNILIDTGGIKEYYKEEWTIKNNNYSLGEDTIIAYLKSIGIKKLDYLILTHGDDDHLGEALTIINNIKVDNVIFNYGSVNNNEEVIIKVLNKKNIKYSFYKDGNELNIYKYKLKFISPIKDYSNENDNSLVIYLDIDNYKFLFMGDASIKDELDIIKKYKINVDVLKVGHHGSKTSSDYTFLNSIKPKYAVMSVGINNKFNHPSDATLDNLNKVNAKILRTDEMGSIKFKLGNNNLEIEMCAS